jgi:hypothetical protein
MPHFVDVGIQNELQARFKDRFYKTSSHKFRHPRDMQVECWLVDFLFLFFLSSLSQQARVCHTHTLTLHTRLDYIHTLHTLAQFAFSYMYYMMNVKKVYNAVLRGIHVSVRARCWVCACAVF